MFTRGGRHSSTSACGTDAVQKGCEKVTICTVDTDMVKLAVTSFSKIAPDKLWVAFGVGSRFRYIPIHKTFSTINPTQCLISQSFTLSQDVTPYLLLLAEERRLPG